MKRFKDIEERLLKTEDAEEQLMLNELTLARNAVLYGKRNAVKGMGKIILPIPGTNPVERRIGLYDETKYKSSDIDIDIMQGTIRSQDFLVIRDDCATASGYKGNTAETE